MKTKFLSLRGRVLQLQLGILCLSVLLFSGLVSAAQLGEEFKNGSAFKTGSLVSLSQTNPDEIELASVNNSEYLLGVVVAENANSVTFAKDDSESTVAYNGDVEVFVSDVNGTVEKGDFISTSWLEGVGMKTTKPEEQRLLGVAVDAYDPDQAQAYGEIETPDGTKNISIDTITVRLFDKQGLLDEAGRATGLEAALENITGKDITAVRIIIGSILFTISIAIAALFIMSSIRGSFISIGRNPLSSASIYKSLLHVSGLSAIVVLIGAALSYVVLVV